MAILTKGQTFADGDQVTSAKLNNLVDQATFKTGAGEAVDGTTMLVDAGGYLKAGTMQTGNLATGSVTTGKIADLNVTTGKIADANVTTGKIADANVTTPKIADANVTTGKIADGAITPAKLTGAQAGAAPIFGIRAWVVFDMTRNAAGTADALNTTRFIRSSGNVTSVTKNATGDFTVAFTTEMADVEYGWFGAAMSDDSDGDFTIGRVLSGTKTTTTLRLKCVNTGNSARDSAEVCISIIR
jgi:hypothetical protein